MSPGKGQDIVHAYRSLYRLSLQAVHYSVPARYQIRDILRSSFRESPAADYDPIRIANTLKFLNRAKKYNGYEHKILRNILFVRYWRGKHHHSKFLDKNDIVTTDIRMNSWSQFSATVAMLNDSQDLCLRT